MDSGVEELDDRGFGASFSGLCAPQLTNTRVHENAKLFWSADSPTEATYYIKVPYTLRSFKMQDISMSVRRMSGVSRALILKLNSQN